MNPYRLELTFTVAAPDLEAAGRIADSLVARAAAAGVASYEGGVVERIADEDVVEGGPLARRLDEVAA